jgi:hypothetical protein
MNQTRRGGRIVGFLLLLIAAPIMLITLIALEPLPMLGAQANLNIAEIGRAFIQVASVVGAAAVVIGVLNLLRANLRGETKPVSRLYGIVTVLVFLAVLAAHILERLGVLKVGDGASPLLTFTLMDTLQVAIESAIAGMLFFFLIYAAYRMARTDVNLWKILFLFTLLIVLLGYNPVKGTEILSVVRAWVLEVPANAGIRGLLIGVGIGAVVIGARVLLGQDRTFRG